MSEFNAQLNEVLTDEQRREYDEYARRLRRVESADYIYAEQTYCEQKLEQMGEWLTQGVEGADTLGEMVNDCRRKRDLCAAEIKRRERAGKFPPSGKVFVDYSEAKQAIKARTVEVIDSYTRLEKRGKEYFGVCPFHEDHHPSLRVNADKQLWFCDPCGTGGDVFDFIARMERFGNA